MRLFRRRRDQGRHAVPLVVSQRPQGGWRALAAGLGRLWPGGGSRGVEERAVTSVPWNVGPPLYNRAVTPEQALSLVPVFSAVRLLSSQIASLPLQTYRKVGTDSRVKIPTGALFTAPAARGTLYDWLHRCVTSLALRGNAYGLVTQRDALGYPTMVEWLHPDHVTVQDSNMSGPGSYVQPIWYWLGRILPTEDLVHIAWFTVPGKALGLSPIEACAATISTGVSAQVYTSDWFNNGAVPPGKFKNTQKTVSQDESDEIKARLNAAIRSRKPLVYGADWDYDPIAVSAAEAKFIETMQMNATQVASIYGIPPEMLGGQAGGALTYNTVEQNSINFVKFTLRPWLELLEETFTALLPRSQYVKFNIDALLRGDLTTRMNAYQVARQVGLNNVDELRSLEEWAPLPNGEGKDYTPLLVQVAASRGIDAAQVKVDQAPSDQPDTQPANGGGTNGSGKPPNGRALPDVLQAAAVPDLAVRLAHSAEGVKGAEQLHAYWTHGEGLAKWADTATPWTSLYHHLLKYLPPEEAKKTASRWFEEVFGFAAGSDLNRVTHGKPPRGHVVGPG
jgi:HK97 family phage portal protein